MSHHNTYLESKVLTASPQKLHLMLIEGAIRFGLQTRMHLERGDLAAAEEPFERTFDIVEEMLASVRGKKTQINLKLAELYLFVFRRLAEAKIDSDVAKLNEAISVLEYEKETWQMACEQVEAEHNSKEQEASETRQQSSQPARTPLMPHLPQSNASQLSLEA